MRRGRVHRERTTLDVLDHVLDKGVVVEAESRRAAADGRGDVAIAGIRLLGVNARVDVTGLDGHAGESPPPTRR